MEKWWKSQILDFWEERKFRWEIWKSNFLRKCMQYFIKQLDMFPRMKMNLDIQVIKIRCWIVRMWSCYMWLGGLMWIRRVCYCSRVMGSLFIRLLVQNEKKKKSMKSGWSPWSQIRIVRIWKSELYWMMGIWQNLQKWEK